MTLERKRVIHAFKTGATIGNYEDVQLTPEDVDPQVELARNTVTQPFYLIIDEDTILAQMSGSARIRMKDSPANYFNTVVGDHVYVPAGTPHRIEPLEESVMVRYTSNSPVRRGAAFFCETCGSEMYRLEWEHNGATPGAQVYAEAVRRFNTEESARVCETCGASTNPIDLVALGWAQE